MIQTFNPDEICNVTMCNLSAGISCRGMQCVWVSAGILAAVALGVWPTNLRLQELK